MTSPNKSAYLLVVDDEPDLRTLYEITLQRAGYQVQTASDVQQARSLLEQQHFDVMITDMRLPDGQGLELVQWLHDQKRTERSIVITAYSSADNAVLALKAGAFDYLSKPVNLDQFRQVVAQAIRASSVQNKASLLPVAQSNDTSIQPDEAISDDTLAEMIGSSELMQQLKNTLLKVAPSMAPVLVLGESGTGKELVARALHRCSHRASGPFIAVNCGAIPETLLEAEFFGAKKGAYTGSVSDREGFFQAANGGTLFLDEIGDLPLSMQAKLLRVIQERQVRPLGATQELAVDVRIVSATHKDLVKNVQAGSFRQDLYYRLNVIDIRVPALRERREDIPELASALLRKITTDMKAAPPSMSPEFVQRLQQLPLAGNVRELENTLHRCFALSDGKVLGVELLQDAAQLDVPLLAYSTLFEQPSLDTSSEDIAVAPLAHEVNLPYDLEAFVNAHEKALLLRALKQVAFNRTAAAALLGLNLRQIRYRMERLGIVDAKNEPVQAPQ